MPMIHDSKQNLLPGGATISKNSPHISDWPLDHKVFSIHVYTRHYEKMINCDAALEIISDSEISLAPIHLIRFCS